MSSSNHEWGNVGWLVVFLFGASGMSALYAYSIREEIRRFLNLRNPTIEPFRAKGWLADMPFDDLDELRDLIEKEPDSLLTPKFRHLMKARGIAIGAAAALAALAIVVIGIHLLAD